MKLLATGDNTIDLSELNSPVQIPLVGTQTYFENELDREINVKVSVRFHTVNLVGTNTITFKVYTGWGFEAARMRLRYKDTIVTATLASSKKPVWETPEMILSAHDDNPADANGDTFFLIITASSNHNGGTDANNIGIIARVMDMSDVQVIGGKAVTLSSNRLDVNTEAVLDAPPTSVADIVAGFLAMTGITEGDSWSFAKQQKVFAAYLAGRWQLKSGETDVFEVLDPDDGSTVVLEVTLSNTTPYRQIAVQI